MASLMVSLNVYYEVKYFSVTPVYLDKLQVYLPCCSLSVTLKHFRATSYHTTRRQIQKIKIWIFSDIQTPNLIALIKDIH
jgi:hypothetical protein